MSRLETQVVNAEGDGAGEGTAGTISARFAFPWQARLVVLAAIWGMSFLFIKVGDEALAPLQVALGRTVLGAATLLLIVAGRRERLPRGFQVWRHLAVASILFNALPFSLFAYGELHTTSVLAGIWNATTPLFAAPLAILMLPGERLSRNRLTGLVTGFVGVLIVLGVWQGLGGSGLLGNLLCLGASASYGLGFPYARKHLAGRGDSTLALATGQVLCATVELAIITPFLTHTPHVLPVKVIASVIALGVLGTGIAYILNYGLIRDAGATNASTVTYLIPLFSTVLGIIVLGEPLAWYEPVGAVLVIVGVIVSQDRLRGLLHRPKAGGEVA
jgi:drug/metabolite transporter (DMT)-like permease